MKEVFITTRDHDLFYDLYTLIFLEVDYIQQVHYPKASRPTISKRMKLLEEHKYIKSFRLPMQNPNPAGRTKNVYTLDENGLREVRELVGEITWDYRRTQITPLGIYHTLQMAMVYAAYRKDENEKLKMHEWISQSRAQHTFSDVNKGDVVKPDGLMLLDSPEKGRIFSFMMELERSRQSPEVTIKKMKRYNKYCSMKKYLEHEAIIENIVKPRIVWISTNENESRNLMKHIEDVDSSHTAGVLFTTYEEVLEDPYGRIFRAKDATDPSKKISLTDRIE